MRVDQKNKRIYLRTEPGSPPRAITLNDIKSVDKGVIREVNFKGDVNVPEIQMLELFNGSRRTVHFNAPTLSPGELTQLTELEKAENELARVDCLTESQDGLTNRLAALQMERQQMLNDLLRQRWMTSTYYATPMYTGLQAGMMSLPLPLEFWFDSGNGNPSLGRVSAPPVQDSVVVTAKTELVDKIAGARRDLTVLRNRAVYENGLLVAVITEDRNK